MPTNFMAIYKQQQPAAQQLYVLVSHKPYTLPYTTLSRTATHNLKRKSHANISMLNALPKKSSELRARFICILARFFALVLWMFFYSCSLRVSVVSSFASLYIRSIVVPLKTNSYIFLSVHSIFLALFSLSY